MHRTKRKILYDSNDGKGSGRVIIHQKRCSNDLFDGFIKRLHRSLIEDDSRRICNVSGNKIAASHKFQSEGFCKIKIHLKLIPLQLRVLEFGKLDVRADEAITLGAVVERGAKG